MINGSTNTFFKKILIAQNSLNFSDEILKKCFYSFKFHLLN